MTSKLSNDVSVSVVMSVYNGEKYLREAINSILNQTFVSFEFIVINDGSTDATASILKSYDDSRMRVITHKNKGLSYSLNEGIKQAKGQYIARIDADDISYPQRLELEFKLAQEQSLDVVGAFFDLLDPDGHAMKTFTSPLSDTSLKRLLYIRNPLCHGATMFKKSTFLKTTGYSETIGPVEDYDLWIRLYLLGAKFGVVPSSLYGWRMNINGISMKSQKTQGLLARELAVSLWTKMEMPQETIRGHMSIVRRNAKAITDRGYRVEYLKQASTDQFSFMKTSFRVRHYKDFMQDLVKYSFMLKSHFYTIAGRLESLARTALHSVRRGHPHA